MTTSETTPQLLPLPQAAHGPTVAWGSYHVEDIATGVYYVTDGSYQAMFTVTDTRVLVVDAPPLIGDNLNAAIRQVTDRPITDLVLSHHHHDHVGAAPALAAAAQADGSTVRIHAHRDTARLLARTPLIDRDVPRPVPTDLFDTTTTLDLDGHPVVLRYDGPNHSPGNSTIWLPQARVAMLVDVVFPGWAPFKALGVAADIPGYIHAHDQLLKLPFDTLVAGHVARPGTRADVVTQREYVTDLQRLTAEAFTAVDYGQAIARAGTHNNWATVDTWYQLIVDRVATQMTQLWGTRLGGADVFARDNATAMMLSTELD